VCTVVFVLVAPALYAENTQKLAQLQVDVADLKSKKTILDSSLGNNPGVVDDDVKIMNKLIPEAEDYFSIIAALENLSAKTSFVVTSYDINVKESGENKLSLHVTGIGDQQSFIDFLRQYNLQGERLITIENISLGEDESGGFTLALNFYNKKASSISGANLDYNAALNEIEAIKNKVHFNLSDVQTNGNADYQKKSNPF
jgi:hypothetical protein